jgi:hypothetical protein
MEKTKNGTVKKALAVGTALISLSALDASKAQAATGTVNMTAVVLTPIVITSPTPLNFGSLTDTGAGGTVQILPVSGIQPAGGGTTSVGSTVPTAGVLSITAATGVAIDLAMTAGPFTVTNGTTNMSVTGFNLVTDAGGTTETITLGASPTTYPVGATLNVGAAQATGTYNGTFSVTAVYQ